MIRRPQNFRPRRFFLVTFLLGVVWAPAIFQAQDSTPIFLPRTGGVGKPPSKLAELAADAERGDPQAAAQLGERLLRGDGAPQDVPRAVALLEQAARAGVGSAAFRLGMVLDDGEGLAQDRRRALDYFHAAAAGGVTEAFFNVGAAYAGAHGVKRDYPEGLAWLIVATKRGASREAEESVRTRILKLRRPDWIAAAEQRAPLIEKEIAASSVSSLLPAPAPFVFAGSAPVDSTDSTFDGVGTPVLKLPPVRSKTGSADSSPTTGTGPAVKLVLPTGREMSWSNVAELERAAERGESGAPAAWGEILLTGKLVPADPIRAVNVLERAAQAGSADAAQLLAEVYSNGEKLLRDDAKVFTYTLQAARGGSRQAMFNVGVLYTNGRGVMQDYTAALTWLIVAQHFGVDSGAALKRVRTYVEKTSPAQLTVAETRAAELQSKIEIIRGGINPP